VAKKNRIQLTMLANNRSLQRCSLTAQGTMFRLVALMETLDPPGPLYNDDGSPMGYGDLADRLSLDPSDLAGSIRELKAECVLDEDPDTGAWYYQPLARSLATSVARVKAGSKGGKTSQAKRLFTTDGDVTDKGTLGQANDSDGTEQNRVPKTVASPWLLWLRAHRKAGVYRENPPANGPDLKAAKELSKQIPSEASLEKAMISYLLDNDEWVCRQGHPLRLLPARLMAYFRVADKGEYDSDDKYSGADWRRRHQDVEEYNVGRTDREIAEGAIRRKEADDGEGTES